MCVCIVLQGVGCLVGRGCGGPRSGVVSVCRRRGAATPAWWSRPLPAPCPAATSTRTTRTSLTLHTHSLYNCLFVIVHIKKKKIWSCIKHWIGIELSNGAILHGMVARPRTAHAQIFNWHCSGGASAQAGSQLGGGDTCYQARQPSHNAISVLSYWSISC